MYVSVWVGLEWAPEGPCTEKGSNTAIPGAVPVDFFLSEFSCVGMCVLLFSMIFGMVFDAK